MSSYGDLLIFYSGLKLTYEASTTKVKSRESYLDISIVFTQNAIFPCASLSTSSRHNIATSSDELLIFPWCSNNEASIFASTCVTTNLVEKIKELKA
jgi:hypothetical protein